MSEVLPSGGKRGPSPTWPKVAFIFDDGKWVVTGHIWTGVEASRVILSALPIVTEGLVINEAEILIMLDPTAKAKIQVDRRIHWASPTDIIYRPQIPAISIFADYADIYEPVVRIGFIRKEDTEKLVDLARNVKKVLYVEVIEGGKLDAWLKKKAKESGRSVT